MDFSPKEREDIAAAIVKALKALGELLEAGTAFLKKAVDQVEQDRKNLRH
jgi:hypothetical protein